MPITITITDPTPEQIAALFGVTMPAFGPVTTIAKDAEPEKPKAMRGKPSPKAETAEPAADPEDAEMAREMAADIAQAEPEPTGARQVVDAGTGRPVAEPVSLTMDQVRANATRLAQADAGRLKAILGEFGAAKLSEVPADQLPDFAGRVLEALG